MTVMSMVQNTGGVLSARVKSNSTQGWVKTPMPKVSDLRQVKDPAVLASFYNRQIRENSDMTVNLERAKAIQGNSYQLFTRIANDWLAEGDPEAAAAWFSSANAARESLMGAENQLIEHSKNALYIDRIKKLLQDLKAPQGS